MKLFLILLSFYISNTEILQKNPDASSNYRFIGDTLQYDNMVVFKLYHDELLNDSYYKPFQQYKIKEWTKYYGFVQVWWVDPDSRKWVYKYLLDYYWRFSIHLYNEEIIMLDENLQPIKYYKKIH